MIDPKELRIGNWIKDFNDRYGLVTSFNQHRVWVRSWRLVNGYDCTLQDLYPIPLTEDILIKCGFDLLDKEFTKGAVVYSKDIYCTKGFFHVHNGNLYCGVKNNPK